MKHVYARVNFITSLSIARYLSYIDIPWESAIYVLLSNNKYHYLPLFENNRKAETMSLTR